VTIEVSGIVVEWALATAPNGRAHAYVVNSSTMGRWARPRAACGIAIRGWALDENAGRFASFEQLDCPSCRAQLDRP
jgi:hypothetical protein